MAFTELEKLEVKPKSAALMWFNSYSGTALKIPSTTVIIDPYQIKGFEVKKADLILISHEHYDHLDPDLVSSIQKNTNATILTSPVVARQLEDIPQDKIKTINMGDSFNIGKIKITAERARHPSQMPLTFVFETDDGIVIYHAIDSQTFDGMKKIGEKYKPDIAIIPVGIAPGVSITSALHAVELISPKVVIPHHTDLIEVEGPKFKRHVDEQMPYVKVVELKKGQIYTYSK
ncbi:MAG: MBL fold metallo-hydrolase [Euryarchaeota archaeon]|nr:MBL fold metallo-hydrolase [Euryarchaeota archaeon]